MKITIKGKEEDYEPDYPDGWKFSAGDPFKFPVLIGDSQCFIKRFEQKSPEDISGWGLLTSIAGKDEKNLSNIYDIKSVQENEKEIYYVFYEYFEGTTLDKYIQNADVNLTHLTDDLYKALKSLKKYEYWFADFCEKNIFCQKDRIFTLVDVDSTQRISDLPDNEMYGSKDYWILVLKFYKEILNINDIRLSDINGISFNYLQVIFLILRLKLFLKGTRKDYNSTELFNRLPSQLYETAPDVREIFLNVSKNGKQPISQDQINKIEDIINRRIIRNDNIKDIVIAPVNLPAIKEFNTSNLEVKSGGTFTLSWQVENVNKLELYKNGAMFKVIDISKKDLALTAFADGTRKQSTYQMIAYKDLAMAKSDSVVVKLIENNNESVKFDYLLNAVPWARLTGIAGLVFCVLAIIASISIAYNSNDDFFYWIISILFNISVLILFFSIIFLLRFANKMKLGLNKNDDKIFTASFKNIRFYFLCVGTFVILFITISLILFTSYLINN